MTDKELRDEIKFCDDEWKSRFAREVLRLRRGIGRVVRSLGPCAEVTMLERLLSPKKGGKR